MTSMKHAPRKKAKDATLLPAKREIGFTFFGGKLVAKWHVKIVAKYCKIFSRFQVKIHSFPTRAPNVLVRIPSRQFAKFQSKQIPAKDLT